MKSEADKKAAASGGVLACFAVKEEKVAFQKIAGRNAGVSILVTGIGRENAEKSVRDFLADKTPARVLSCGFAGALVPDLAIGAVVFETDDMRLRGQLTAAGARAVKFHCADRIATTSREKQELRRRTNAGAVEMESEVIRSICREHHLPCATVRVISDTVDEDLPLDFNLLSKPDRSLDYGRLAWTVAKSPGKIGALRRLQKQTRFAAEQLAAVLAKVISP